MIQKPQTTKEHTIMMYEQLSDYLVSRCITEKDFVEEQVGRIVSSEKRDWEDLNSARMEFIISKIKDKALLKNNHSHKIFIRQVMSGVFDEIILKEMR